MTGRMNPEFPGGDGKLLPADPGILDGQFLRLAVGKLACGLPGLEARYSQPVAGLTVNGDALVFGLDPHPGQPVPQCPDAVEAGR